MTLKYTAYKRRWGAMHTVTAGAITEAWAEYNDGTTEHIGVVVNDDVTDELESTPAKYTHTFA